MLSESEISTLRANPPLEPLLQAMKKAPALADPSGYIVRVNTAAEFVEAVDQAKDKSTILLADGVYKIPRSCVLQANDVTIRSASGQREAVILDGQDCDLTYTSGLDIVPLLSILKIFGAKNACIADITFKNSDKYGIAFYGDSEVWGLNIYNVKFHNIWVRGLKGSNQNRIGDSFTNTHSPEKGRAVRPKDGQVKYCLFINDDPKMEDGIDHIYYLAGMDLMGIKDWTISDNLFIGIRSRVNQGNAGIFIWQDCERVLIERNIVINCDQGINLGNFGHRKLNVDQGIVRDNIIVSHALKAMEFCNTSNCQAYNNIVYATNTNFPSVRFLDGATGDHLHHNLIHGTLKMESPVDNQDNFIGDFSDCFVNPEYGDFMLTEKGHETFGDWTC